MGKVGSDEHAATSSCLGRVFNSADDDDFRAIKGKVEKPSVNVNI